MMTNYNNKSSKPKSTLFEQDDIGSKYELMKLAHICNFLIIKYSSGEHATKASLKRRLFLRL